MKKHTIIGTAGHIDHGKTAVIKALTGIDADRLKEEKERGITIDIGFAYWKDNVTILDVPGHEKFIRNMVAGVSTVDFFLLIIAADDGIMPQTIEHLDILNFFNIKDGIVILNKIDLVDDEWLSLIEDDVINLLKKYHLENLPVVKVSAVTNINIENLRDIIELKIENQPEVETTQPFRLLVDRSFTIKGFGTVVTGTVLSGTLKKGEDIEILPQEIKKKVRGLQAHGNDTELVSLGDRAAVNLQAISKLEITRGDVLVRDETMLNTIEFIGTMRTVSNFNLKIGNRSKIRVYVGTAERIGQLIWFEDKKFLEKESEYHVRIKLNVPLAVARNDAFLIRLHSPVVTLAGGRVIEINPPNILHQGDEWIPYFERMASNDYSKIINTIITKSNLEPVSDVFLQKKLFEQDKIITKAIENLKKQKKIRTIKIKGLDHYVSETSFGKLADKIEQSISDFHKKHPYLPGLNHQELFTSSGYSWVRPDIFDAAIKKLLNSNILKLDQNYYSLNSFSIQVSRDIDVAQNEILKMLRDSKYSPGTISEVAQKIDMPQNEVQSIINILVKNQKLININRDIFIELTIWEDLLSFLRDYFDDQKEMPVTSLKEFINTTRKYAIPIFEYLDSQGYTLRAGDVRKKGHKL
jgi:selenocysteine-specific elongation factor